MTPIGKHTESIAWDVGSGSPLKARIKESVLRQIGRSTLQTRRKRWDAYCSCAELIRPNGTRLLASSDTS